MVEKDLGELCPTRGVSTAVALREGIAEGSPSPNPALDKGLRVSGRLPVSSTHADEIDLTLVTAGPSLDSFFLTPASRGAT